MRADRARAAALLIGAVLGAAHVAGDRASSLGHRPPQAFGAGVTALDAPLVLRSGDGVTGAGMNVTTLRPVAPMTSVVANADEEAGAADVTLADLTIDCDGRADFGVRLVRVSNLRLRGVRVTNCTRDGVRLSGHGVRTRRFRLEDVEAANNGEGGVVVQWAMRDGVYDGVVATGNGGTGITIDHSEATAHGLVARGNGRDGLYLRNLFATTISEVSATHNGRHGVLVEGWVHSVGSAWRAQGNGQGDGGAADVLFSGRADLSYGVTRASVLTGLVAGDYHELGAAPGPVSGLAVDPDVTDLTIIGVVQSAPEDARAP